jgi:MFS family permease
MTEDAHSTKTAPHLYLLSLEPTSIFQKSAIFTMSSPTTSDSDEESVSRSTARLSDGATGPVGTSNIPSICCALLASMTTGGTTYAFGLYGSTLKRNLHLSQTQLDTISTATFLAGLLSWIPGMFIDRFGTRFGISLGGFTGSVALMIYWIVAKGFVEFSDNEWVVISLSVLGVIIFLSCALVTGSVFKIISCNCGPGTKGAAVGVAKGYVGLGAGAYACLFQSIREPTTSDLDFLPMAAFFFVVAASIPSWIFLPDKQNEGKMSDALTPLHFKVLYSSLIILAFLIVSTSLAELYNEKHNKNEAAAPNPFLTAVILLIWIGPIVGQTLLPRNQHVAVYAIIEEEERETLLRSLDSEVQEPTSDSTVDSSSKLQTPPNEEGALESEACDTEIDDASVRSQRDTNKNLYQMLQTPEAWLMIWTTTILVGAGTVETNNLGQMVESLGFSPVVASASLALFSVAQAAGRVATGALSENALTWNTKRCLIDKGVPRPFFLVIASLIGILAHFILAVSTFETPFVIGIALSGYSFGMVWPMMVLIVGELFGSAHVGANYLFFDGFTSAAGTFLLSKVVAQEVYETHIEPSAHSDSTTCYGEKCFELTHIVIAILSVTCVVSSLAMQYMTRHSYNNNNNAHLRDE